MVGGVLGVILITIIVALIVVKSRNRRRSVVDIELKPQDSLGDFGEFVIPYAQLTFKKKIGEGLSLSVDAQMLGAFGEVHKGEYQKTKVAIKVIPSNKIDAKVLDEFKSEATTMKLAI